MSFCSFRNYVLLFCLALGGCGKNDPQPQYDFNTYGSKQIGFGNSFGLTVSVTNEHWDFGDGSSIDWSDSKTNRVEHYYNRPGDFVVAATIDNKFTVSKHITIGFGGYMRYSGSPVVGDSIHFYYTPSLASGYNYLWNFGDGGSSADSTPYHVYTATGTYNVSFSLNDISVGSLTDGLRIYRDPLYTNNVAGTRTFQGDRRVVTNDTTWYHESKDITIGYVDKVTLTVDGEKYIFYETTSTANVLYFIAYPYVNLGLTNGSIYYNRAADSISIHHIGSTQAYHASPIVTEYWYHSP